MQIQRIKGSLTPFILCFTLNPVDAGGVVEDKKVPDTFLSHNNLSHLLH